MVGHHTGGIDTTSQRLFPFPQIIEVGLVIRVVRKDHVAIVPPVHDMMREIRHKDPGGAGERRVAEMSHTNKSVHFFCTADTTTDRPHTLS